MAELYGPVVIDSTSPFFLGAAVCSNNTGELTAIGEGLLWLRDCSSEILCKCCQSSLSSSSSSSSSSSFSISTKACVCRPLSVSIRYDSEYAAKSIQGLFNGDKNKDLINTIRKVYNSLINAIETAKDRSEGSGSHQHRRRVVVMNWTKVKAHSGDRWNERADQLATRGISGEMCTIGRFLKQQQQQQQQQSSSSNVKQELHCDEGEEYNLDVEAVFNSSTGNENLMTFGETDANDSGTKKRRLDR